MRILCTYLQLAFFQFFSGKSFCYGAWLLWDLWCLSNWRGPATCLLLVFFAHCRIRSLGLLHSLFDLHLYFYPTPFCFPVFLVTFLDLFLPPAWRILPQCQKELLSSSWFCPEPYNHHRLEPLFSSLAPYASPLWSPLTGGWTSKTPLRLPPFQWWTWRGCQRLVYSSHAFSPRTYLWSPFGFLLVHWV